MKSYNFISKTHYRLMSYESIHFRPITQADITFHFGFFLKLFLFLWEGEGREKLGSTRLSNVKFQNSTRLMLGNKDGSLKIAIAQSVPIMTLSSDRAGVTTSLDLDLSSTQQCSMITTRSSDVITYSFSRQLLKLNTNWLIEVCMLIVHCKNWNLQIDCSYTYDKTLTKSYSWKMCTQMNRSLLCIITQIYIRGKELWNVWNRHRVGLRSWGLIISNYIAACQFSSCQTT